MSILKNFPHQSKRVSTTWKSIKKNWLIDIVNKFTLLLLLLSVGLLIWKWQTLPPQVPLWYSRPWGADQLASPLWLILLPVMSMCIYGINILISIYITAEYLLFTQMLFVTSLIVSMLSFISLTKILFLIT